MNTTQSDLATGLIHVRLRDTVRYLVLKTMYQAPMNEHALLLRPHAILVEPVIRYSSSQGQPSIDRRLTTDGFSADWRPANRTSTVEVLLLLHDLALAAVPHAA